MIAVLAALAVLLFTCAALQFRRLALLSLSFSSLTDRFFPVSLSFLHFALSFPKYASRLSGSASLRCLYLRCSQLQKEAS